MAYSSPERSLDVGIPVATSTRKDRRKGVKDETMRL